MTDIEHRAACVAALVACSVAAAYLGGALKAITWACAIVSMAMSACTPAARSPLVQVTRWPATQARPEPAHCSGFAANLAVGTRILTAGHCVAAYAIGERVPVVTRQRWDHTSQGVRWARLERVDGRGDVAVLAPEDATMAELEALPVANRAPVHGELVRLQSGRYWAESRGVVEGRYYADVGGQAGERWSCTASIEPGWSGSAVLDADGRVLGVVTSCQAVLTATDSVVCRPGFAAFQAVP